MEERADQDDTVATLLLGQIAPPPVVERPAHNEDNVNDERSRKSSESLLCRFQLNFLLHNLLFGIHLINTLKHLLMDVLFLVLLILF